jgi:hypothetical protein
MNGRNEIETCCNRPRQGVDGNTNCRDQLEGFLLAHHPNTSLYSTRVEEQNLEDMRKRTFFIHVGSRNK